MALPWLCGSRVARAASGCRGAMALVDVVYVAEQHCFPSAGAGLDNMNAMAQMVLAFSQGTTAAHWSPSCGVLALGKLGGSLEPMAWL